MPLWLLKFLPEIATAAMVAILAYALHCGAMDGLRLDHINDLAQQAKNEQAACQKSKDITKEFENALQSQIRALRAKSSQPKYVCNTRSVPLQSADSAIGNDGRAGAGEPVRQNGVSAQSLYGLAADAETYRLRLIACQSFIQKTWDSLK